MRAICFLSSILVTMSAMAGPPTSSAGVALTQETVSRKLITGTCGIASVQVSGIEPDPTTGRHIIGAAGAISVTSSGRRLTIGPGSEGNVGVFLQDRNTLRCIDTPTGPKLLLIMHCDGRACAPVDYRVIDSKTSKLLSIPDSDDECDAKCAERALGVPLARE